MALTTRYGFADSPTPGNPATAWTTVASTLSSGATSMSVGSSGDFPSSVEFDIVVGFLETNGTLSNVERMHVTAVSGTTWTVTRTVSVAHASGESIYHELSTLGLKNNPGAMTDSGDFQYLDATGRTARLAAPSNGNYLITWSSAVPSWQSDSIYGRVANPLSQFAATTSAQLAGVISDETGTNLLVFNTSPTLVTPLLGTPTSGTLTNCAGLPIGSGVSGLGTGVATALGVAVGSAGAFVVNGGVLGTPSSGTLTNATGLPVSTGISGLGSGVATFLATPSSANLASAVTDETGTGLLVFGTAPVFASTITVGTAAGTTGAALLRGTTSGTVTLSVADAAGTWTMKLPTADGTNGQVLTTNGAGQMSFTTVSGGGGLAVGTTTITSGTNTRILYNNAGVLGEYAPTGTGTTAVLSTSPTLTTSLLTAAGQGLFFGTANVTELYNGTTAQSWLVYNTRTDASNYERSFMRYSANVLQIGHEAAGTGTASRTIQFRTNGFAAMTLDTNALTMGVNIAMVGAGISAIGNITAQSGYTEGIEMTAPSAPSANRGRMFYQDNGSGKTQLMVLFNTGAAQQVAIEP